MAEIEYGYGYGGHPILPYGEKYTVSFSGVNLVFTTSTFIQKAPWNQNLSEYEISVLGPCLSDLYKDHSGIKIVSRAVRRRYQVTSDNVIVGYTLLQNALEAIAQLVLVKYGTKWKRLYDAYSVEYNPLNSFSLTTQESGTIDDNRSVNTSDNITHGHLVDTTFTNGRVVTNSGNDITQQGTTVTNYVDEEMLNHNNYNGFNSATSVPVTDSSSTRKTGNSGNRTLNSGSDIFQHGHVVTNSGQDIYSEENSGTDRRSVITSDGNLRTLNTTKQVSGYNHAPVFDLEAYVAFFKNTFFEEVFNDLDKEFTLKLY